MQNDTPASSPSKRAGPKVLLTDTNRWPNSARVAIGLSKAGCVISAICPKNDHPLHFTSAVREIFPYGSLRPLEALETAIKVSGPDIIVPCDDRGVMHLHELYHRAYRQGSSGAALLTLIEKSLGPPESYPIVSCRWRLLVVARDEGICIPDTQLVESAEDLERWGRQRNFPCVLKADGTCGGQGVKIAHNPEEATEYFSEITQLFRAKSALKRAVVDRDPFWMRSSWKRQMPTVIVQEHIQGTPANCAAVCWKGKVMAGIAVEVVSYAEATGPATIVKLVQNRPMMEAAERIAQRLQLSGFFGLDFMIEEGSNTAYLIEMNPRCTPLSHLQLGKRRDLMEAFGAELAGRQLRNNPPVTLAETIAYFPQAWHNLSELPPAAFQDIPNGEPALLEALLSLGLNQSFLLRCFEWFGSRTPKALKSWST